MQEPTSATVAHLQDVKSNGDTGLTFNALMDRAKAVPQDQHAYMDSGEVGPCHCYRSVVAANLSEVAGRACWPALLLSLCWVQMSGLPHWRGQK